MILSDSDIKLALQEGRMRITPSPPGDHFAPSAVDLRIGNEFKRWKPFPEGMIPAFNLSLVNIPKYGDFVEDVRPDEDGLVSVPRNGFILAKTLEKIALPLELAARVEGRSSLARLGLAVHITAPTIHAGFEGPIVLEIKNLGPFTLKLEPGKTAVCQLIFEMLSSTPTGPLRTVFQKQDDVLGSKQS